jgi:hypothetical protein
VRLWLIGREGRAKRPSRRPTEGSSTSNSSVFKELRLRRGGAVTSMSTPGPRGSHNE